MAKWSSRSTAATTSTWNSGPPSAPARPSARSTTGRFRWFGRAIDHCHARLRAPPHRYAAPPHGLSVEPRRAPYRSRFRARPPRFHSPSEPLLAHLRAALSRPLLEESPPRARRLDGIRRRRARPRYGHRTARPGWHFAPRRRDRTPPRRAAPRGPRPVAPNAPLEKPRYIAQMAQPAGAVTP